MYSVTLQLYASGRWEDAMTLVFADPEKGFEGPCRFGYKTGYVADNLEFVDSPFNKAVSARLPLSWESASLKKAPAFLHDIAPAGADSFRLAPIYDLAPMVMDDEGVTRTTKWPKGLEVAGEVKWREVCDSLAQIGDPQALYEGLREDAARFMALPDMLAADGLPEATMNHPAIALRNLEQRLKSWGLK
jgi:hypothetical protein